MIVQTLQKHVSSGEIRDIDHRVERLSEQKLFELLLLNYAFQSNNSSSTYGHWLLKFNLWALAT